MFLISKLLLALSLSSTLVVRGLIHDGRDRLLAMKLRSQENLLSSGINMLGAPSKQKEIAEEFVTLPIDHWNSTSGTYQNRFWVTEADYKPGNPIFIYDAGEGNAGGFADYVLQSPFFFFKRMLEEFNGMGIVWEHRYYGKSAPFPINVNTSSTSFKFLTTEQSLADVPSFAWNFTRTNFPNVDLTPAGTPWVFVGASYPGMRAAFMRNTYPETIFASYASSAPVEASTDMSFYFEPVWQGMNAYGYGNCTRDIQAAILEMDRIMGSGPKASGDLKEKFLGRSGRNNSNGAFADALTGLFYDWQSYGMDGYDAPLGYFCDWISTDTKTKKVSPAEGWAPTKGAQFTIDQWASWPFWIGAVNHALQSNCEGNSFQTLGYDSFKPENCDLEQPWSDPDWISWTWQYCTEWGFFQSVNLGPHQIVSKYNSLEHQRDVCHRQFPDGRSSGLLPEWPKVQESNELYGGWDIRPSNTFWTGGKYDPWRTLSPLSDMSFAPKEVIDQTIPACGTPDQGAEGGPFFGYLIDNGEHGFDFDIGFEPSVPARKLFSQALTQWLKCFKPTKKEKRGFEYGAKTGIRKVVYG